MLKTIGLSNKPASSKNNNSKLASSKNNSSRPISEKNNGNSNIKFNGDGVKHTKKSRKLKGQKSAKSQK